MSKKNYGFFKANTTAKKLQRQKGTKKTKNTQGKNKKIIRRQDT